LTITGKNAKGETTRKKPAKRKKRATRKKPATPRDAFEERARKPPALRADGTAEERAETTKELPYPSRPFGISLCDAGFLGCRTFQICPSRSHPLAMQAAFALRLRVDQNATPYLSTIREIIKKTPMESKLPEVAKGDPVSADLFNALIRRVNARDSKPESTAPVQAKGEFWIRNLSGSSWPAFKPIRINGFVETYATISDAKSAIANDSVVFACGWYGNGKYFAIPLDAIPANGIGRACCPFGALYFLEARADETVVPGSRLMFTTYPAENYGKTFVDEDRGELAAVAFDSTSRLVAAAAIPKMWTIRAGSSVYITDVNDYIKEISADACLHWGCWDGSKYDLTGSIDVAPSGKLVFGAEFVGKSRRDGVLGFEVGLKTTTQTVVTGVDFARNSVTTAQITVLQ